MATPPISNGADHCPVVAGSASAFVTVTVTMATAPAAQMAKSRFTAHPPMSVTFQRRRLCDYRKSIT